MPTVEELTHQAGFVFEGEVERAGASAAAGYPASPETAVVRVTRILKSPHSLSAYQGLQITVALQPPVTLAAGQTAVFFTHGLHYGQGLVVKEVGNLPPEATMDSQVNAAAESAADNELTQRLAQAELVITGTASAPHRLAGAMPGTRRVSEHEPDWWVTTINVESTEKGTHPGPTKDILFANSTDIAWYDSPKPKAGDHGVWLLHNRDHRGKAVPALAVVHKLDFQAIEQAPRVRDLLARKQQ